MPPALAQIPIHFSALYPLHKHNDSNNKHTLHNFNFKFSKPLNYCSISTTKFESSHKHRLRVEALTNKLPFPGLTRGKNGFSVSRRKRVLVVNGFGGGGGGRFNSENTRVLGNIAFAILFTYLSVTGQLDWLLDAIVSLSLLAVLVPITVAVVAFLWLSSRDIIQGSCPNCGNEFQVFGSLLNEELQLCPFCSEPFSVEDDMFVRDPVTFSTIFDQAFDSSPRQNKGKKSSGRVVDVEAQVRDAE